MYINVIVDHTYLSNYKYYLYVKLFRKENRIKASLYFKFFLFCVFLQNCIIIKYIVQIYVILCISYTILKYVCYNIYKY